MRQMVTASTILVLTMIAVPCAAEVMDKAPSVLDNWTWAIITGIVAIGAWYWRWWLGTFVSLVSFLGYLAVYLEIRDPFVGPDIRIEAGEDYVTHFYSAASVGILLNLIGVCSGLYRIVRRRHMTS